MPVHKLGNWLILQTVLNFQDDCACLHEEKRVQISVNKSKEKEKEKSTVTTNVCVFNADTIKYKLHDYSQDKKLFIVRKNFNKMLSYRRETALQGAL